jgi:MFS family permease
MAPTTMARLRQRLAHLAGIHSDYTHPPFALHYRSHTVFIVTTVGVGLFTDLFLYGLVVPILPFLLRDRADIPQSAQQGYVSGLLAAYAGASVLFSPLAGFVADRTSSRQLPFLCGLVLLLLGCLGLYLGQSVAALAVARVLQGLSAAVVWTVGLALCLDTVGPENLGKTIGTVSRRGADRFLGARLTGGDPVGV